jgi:hypothetical protein
MYKFFKIPKASIDCEEAFDYTPTFIYSKDIVYNEQFIIPDDTIIVHMPYYEAAIADIIKHPTQIFRYKYFGSGELHPNLKFHFEYDLKRSLKECLEQTGDVSHLNKFIRSFGITETTSETELRYIDTSRYVRMPIFKYTNTEVDVNNLYVITRVEKEIINIDRYKGGVHASVDDIPMNETVIVQYVEEYIENRLSLMEILEHCPFSKRLIIIFQMS